MPSPGASFGRASEGPAHPNPWLRPTEDHLLVGSFAAEFERVVARFPDRLAVETDDSRLTFDQLNRRVNRNARRLVSLGVSQDAPVAIYLPQGLDALATAFASMKAGGFYLPLDPAFPDDWNARMIADGATRLVTCRRHRERARALAGNSCPLLLVEDLESHVDDDSNLELPIPPDARAYVIATSGSTGAPKGVLQLQASLVHNARNQARAFGFSHEDKVTLCYAPSVMGAVRPTYNALLSGAALSVVDVRTEGLQALRTALKAREITVLHCLATLYRHLMADPDNDAFSSLRVLILGGEAATDRDWDVFRTRFPATCRFFTGLGSTEAGTICVNEIERGSSVPVGNLSPGRPLPGVVLDIVDANRCLLPPGWSGEVAVRSPAMASGYWRRDDLTQSSFVRLHPDSDAVSYLTGDVGRILPDGRLELTGRTDFQIKVRGSKVDLARVERAILDAPAIQDAVAVGHRNRFGDAAVAAFCVSSQTIDPEGLRAFLRARIPDFMLPARLVQIDALPETPGGKVDRKRLIQLAAERELAGHPADAPVRDQQPPDAVTNSSDTPLETLRSMSAIWGRVLRVREVGIHDDFFELGGDSLLAVELALALSEGLRHELTAAVIFQFPTIYRLAEQIKKAAGVSALVTVEAAGTKPPLFFINSVSYFRAVRPVWKDPDRPLISVSIFGLAGRIPTETPPSLASFARVIFDELTQARPTGPFHLATFCGDCYLTLEIARQLRAAGRVVDTLCLIDGIFGPHYPPLRPRLATALKAGPRRTLRTIAARWRFKLRRRGGEETLAASPNAQESTLGRDQRLYAAYIGAKRAYSWEPYAGGGVTLLLSSEWSQADLRRVERTFTAGFHREEIVGFHGSWYDPVFASKLAEATERCLARAQHRS